MPDDFSQDLQTDSTIIDPEIDAVKSGGGKTAVEPPPEKTAAPRKPETVAESLEAEAKKLSNSKDDDEGDEDKEPVAKKDDKTAKEVKPAEAKESEAKAKEGTEQETKTPKPSEGRKIIEAPARLLPQNKELWKGVAHPIREEWVRREQEYEQEITQHREAKQFRDELREYEELATSKGVKFKDALERYVDIDKKFSQDPAMGFRQILDNTGLSPQQAISHILRAVNATPQQLIERMTAAPHEFSSLAPQRQQQPQQQERQPDPEISALKQEVEAMRAERVTNDVIRPFAQEYPEYYDNQDAIAKVLKSGIIDEIHGSSLSPRDKLEAALLMVAPQTKRASGQVVDIDSVRGDDRDTTAPAGDLRGGKSIRSSIGSVADTAEPEEKGKPVRDMLEEELRKISRRA